MNFKTGNWNKEVNVRDFIQRNYTPYDGGKEFLTAPTERTKALWNQLLDLMKVERERKGVYDIDEKTISTITAHNAGYINKDLEQIVGLQTDAPLKRAIMPFGGIRLIHTQLEAYGRQMDPIVDHVFKYRKTHNDGVFDVYTDEMKRARHAGIMTGLPDAYGRGRIIGDYRRVALYGVDFLIAQKQAAKKNMVIDVMDSDHIRKREEIAEQIKALAELKEMAAKYGFDISRPAENTKEAIQWLYFGYLAAVKECIAWLKAHERTLLDGRLTPHRPEFGYPMIEAEGDDERIVAVYEPDYIADLGSSAKPVFVVNATPSGRVCIRRRGRLETLDVPSGGIVELK